MGFPFEDLLPGIVVTGALAARLFPAWKNFLNPDEAMHNLCASQGSLQAVYQAALTNAHPPLLILLVYYFRLLGHSELILRLPSVLAGTACCWLVYKWLELVTDRLTAFVGLLLISFAPPLISLSAEIRQYALLLFFMAGCLYASERAIRDHSQRWMIAFTLSLYGTLLTHYSSYFFALTMGIYMLARLRPYRQNMRMVATWAAGQAGGAALAGYFATTHLLRLKQNGLIRSDAETYLRRYMFHSGENHVAVFVVSQTLRVFTFLFSQGLMGTLGLLAFLTGMVLLIAKRVLREDTRPSALELALLLGLPFIVACGASLAGAYPYGATRHAIFLAPFAIAGISIALGAVSPARPRATILLTAGALAACSLFPAPPPLIRAKDLRRTQMSDAVDYLRKSAPAGSLILADYQSALLLGYYACEHGVVQIFPPFNNYTRSDCGPNTAIAFSSETWKFYAGDFPDKFTALAQHYHLVPGTKIWLFDAGWIEDSTPALSRKLATAGCPTPRTFGKNILICELAVGNASGAADAPSLP